MNTKVILGLAIVIIIGVGAYFLFGTKAATAPSQVTQEPATSQTTGASQQSLSALVAAGSPVTCTFSTTTAAGTQTGTMYVASGMVAGDFSMNSTQGTSMQGHMIVRDQTSYIWMDVNGKTMGFKSSTTAQPGAAPAQNRGVDYNSAMDYSCQAWTPDQSKFTLPTGVTFTDTTAMVPPATPGVHPSTGTAVKGTAGQCAACAELQGAPKEQCLAALHC